MCTDGGFHDRDMFFIKMCGSKGSKNGPSARIYRHNPGDTCYS